MNIDDSEIRVPYSRLEEENIAREYVCTTYPTHKKVKQYYARIKIGRNEPCLCGSGKKYKRCCL